MITYLLPNSPIRPVETRKRGRGRTGRLEGARHSPARPPGRPTAPGNRVPSWPRCTLPAEDLYLSNSVFPLETIIFLERFPLERESFLFPAHVPLQLCGRLGAPLVSGTITDDHRSPKFVLKSLFTHSKRHPALSSSLIPRSAPKISRRRRGTTHGTTPYGHAPFAGYSSRLHMFISAIFPVNFLERFFLGDLYLSICLSRSIHLA